MWCSGTFLGCTLVHFWVALDTNLGKAKLYYILKPWCEKNNLPVLSESTIGRVIAKDKDKMRFTPYRIDRNGKVKPKKKV